MGKLGFTAQRSVVNNRTKPEREKNHGCRKNHGCAIRFDKEPLDQKETRWSNKGAETRINNEYNVVPFAL